MSKFENNLSEGSVTKQLIKFSLPFIISNLIQSLYAVSDMIIVGRFATLNSMSGVHIGNQATFLITSAIIGLCVGGTVLIGQYLGSGKKKELHETISTLFSTLILLSVVITVVMLILHEPFLRLINTPAEALGEARSYLIITLTGTFFIFGYNALSAVMRGMGDSRNPLKFVAVACFTNIALDLLFVAVIKMGASGAALATVLSQGLSMILCILYLRRNKFVFNFSFASFRFHSERLKMLLKVGTPTLFNNISVSVSFLFLTGFANELGLVASTAVGVVGRFNAFAILPAIAMGSAISAMSAQNFGAGKPERAVKTMKVGLVIAVSISYSIFVLTQLFPEVFLRVFNSDPVLIEAGVSYLRPFSFDYIFVPLIFCINGLFIGSGHTTFSLFNGLLSSLLIRIPVAYVLGIVLDKGLHGIGLGAPIAASIAFLSTLIFYFSGRWRKQNIINKHEL